MSSTDKVLANEKLDLINNAREVLRGKYQNSQELEALYKQLEKKDQFAYATELLLRKMQVDEQEGNQVTLKDFQTLAKYIYKDHALPSAFKFEKALQELEIHDDLLYTENCETLGLAGAIYKRKWQFDHQFKNLVLSQYYYKRGYAKWKEYILQTNPDLNTYKNDNGFSAINYAYINDLMAVDRLEELGKITGPSDTITEQLAEANETRKVILEHFISNPAAADPELKRDDYDKWVLATVAEAYFGLQNYNAASKFIKQGIEKYRQKYTGTADGGELLAWELRTFSQQLFSLAYLQLFREKFYNGPASASLLEEQINACLQVFTNLSGVSEGEEKQIEVKKVAKLGLALSGGGFRASLFHIGVLAALAERDMLKEVEVISCVSGGSIIGAYYYLKLKVLLESKTDDEITTEDYIKLVKEIETGFMGGVQKNLRMRVLSNLWCNFKMLFSKNYSRTHRLGELYEKHLFKEVWEKAIKDNEELNAKYKTLLDANDGNIYMGDLFINPKLETGEEFVFGTDNWKRKHKIAQLVLNATSVNTGHNWQFTASWMGEPPGNIQTDIDVKPRLRRMYYADAPGEYKKFRLGYAVGASSCVPVMFHPMPMYDLYPGIDLQLVDGGLHDNQGIAALIEEECRNMIISDASGQLPTNTIATNNDAAVFFRTDNILQERLRELQFMDIKERNYTTQINSLVKVHLKNDLQSKPVSWKFCTDPPRQIFENRLQDSDNDLTSYGILRNVQSQLSEIRTDLDSFSDIESYALMYSGYAQINYECGYNPDDEKQLNGEWEFLKIKDYVTDPAKAAGINKQLSAAKNLTFKAIYVSSAVKTAAIISVILILAGLLYLVYQFFNVEIVQYQLTVKFLFFFLVTFALGYASKILNTVINFKNIIRKYIALVVVLILGFVVCNLICGC